MTLLKKYLERDSRVLGFLKKKNTILCLLVD